MPSSVLCGRPSRASTTRWPRRASDSSAWRFASSKTRNAKQKTFPLPAMFTGLVETLGLVQGVRPEGPGRRLTLSAPLDGVNLGDSVAVNGCCLTVVEATASDFSFAAGPETLRLTNLGELAVG